MHVSTILGAVLAALLLSFTAPASAQDNPPDVAGWWRADVEHNGERESFYLHFDQHEGAARARFTIPAIRMHEVFAGPYRVLDNRLQMPGLGWQLEVREGGLVIEGVLPAGLVAVYRIPARFERSDAAPVPTVLTPQQQAPQPLWTAPIGAPVWAGLTHDRLRNAIYVASDDGRVASLVARTGARRWSTELGAPIRATPTLAGQRLFVATDVALFALNPRTGAQMWSAPFGAQRADRLPMSDPNSAWDHYSASAAVYGDFLAIAGRDGCVYTLNARNGRQRWRSCVDEGILTGTPAITRDAIYVGGFDGAAYAFSRADGALLWRRDLHAPIPRDPVVSGDTVVFGSRSYDLVALNARTSEPVWSRYFWFSWIDSPPVLRDGALYVGASDGLAIQSFDAATGARRWASLVPGWSWSMPAVTEERVYASVAGGPYLTQRYGGFAAIDRANGALRWLHEVPQPSDENETYGFAAAPVAANGVVFAADLSGTVYAFPD